MSTITVNHTQASDMLFEILSNRRVPMLWGSPGIGKSDIIRQLAKDCSLKVIDLRLSQCDPTDLLGFPTTDKASGKAGYLPMDTFPIEGDPIPQGYKGWLLLLDELPGAHEAVQKASYKLILDRMVGQYKLHEKCMIAAAGNQVSDNALVEEMSTALQSRLIHMTLEVNHHQFLKWAMNAGIDHRITDFIKFDPKQVYTFRPDHTDKTYACPRTWEMANDFVKGRKEITEERIPILGGTLSEGVARTFVGYCQVYKDLPTIDQIIAHPETLAVPDEPSVLWALTGCIGNNATEGNLDSLIKYVSRISEREFQAITCLEISRRNKLLTKTKAFRDWVIKSGVELF